MSSLKKIIFIPNCLNEKLSNETKIVAEKNNYEVYKVNGGPLVKKIVNEIGFENIEKVVGIACQMEISMMKSYAKEKNMDFSKIHTIALQGTPECKNTFYDLKEVLKVL